MKEKIVIDLGRIMDEIFEAAQDFGDAFKGGFKTGPREEDPFFQRDDKVDYYPSYQYPPANVYMPEDHSLVFEFALAGFEEPDLSLELRGDYMVFSAMAPPAKTEPTESIRFFKKRLKFKDIEGQKYYVPENRFDREKIRAVLTNGILKITVPPKAGATKEEAVKVEIVKEGE